MSASPTHQILEGGLKKLVIRLRGKQLETPGDNGRLWRDYEETIGCPLETLTGILREWRG